MEDSLAHPNHLPINDAMGVNKTVASIFYSLSPFFIISVVLVGTAARQALLTFT
jgi:hypothetical protein